MWVYCIDFSFFVFVCVFCMTTKGNIYKCRCIFLLEGSVVPF